MRLVCLTLTLLLVVCAFADETAAPVEGASSGSDPAPTFEAAPEEAAAAAESLPPVDKPLKAPQEDEDVAGDLSYLEHVGFGKKASVDECRTWHQQLEESEKELGSEAFAEIKDTERHKHFLDAHLAHLTRQIETFRAACLVEAKQRAAETGGEEAAAGVTQCDEFAQKRIQVFMDQMQHLQKEMNTLLPKLNGELPFQKSQLEARTVFLRKEIAQRCPQHVQEQIQKDKADKQRHTSAQGGAGRRTEFATYEEMMKYMRENDPDSPENIEKARKQQEAETERRRIELSKQTLEHFSKIHAEHALSEAEVQRKLQEREAATRGGDGRARHEEL